MISSNSLFETMDKQYIYDQLMNNHNQHYDFSDAYAQIILSENWALDDGKIKGSNVDLSSE